MLKDSPVPILGSSLRRLLSWVDTACAVTATTADEARVGPLSGEEVVVLRGLFARLLTFGREEESLQAAPVEEN